MKTSILIVTHAKDKEWLEPCLKSIFMFCFGFHEVVVALQNRDKAELFPILTRYPVKSWGFDEIEGHGFNHHQAVICMADQICEDADLILHVDVDCIFIRNTSPQEYIKDNKPILIIRDFEWFRTRHTGAYGWKHATESAFGFPVTRETMRRFPIVHSRHVYAPMRSHIESVHKKPFLDFMISHQDRHGISDFNLLGSFAFHKFHDLYSWYDLAMSPWDTNLPLLQGVSYAGLDALIPHRTAI